MSAGPCTGNTFVSVSSDKTIKMWKTNKKEYKDIANAERTIQAHEKDINVIKYSWNEKLLATGS